MAFGHFRIYILFFLSLLQHVVHSYSSSFPNCSNSHPDSSIPPPFAESIFNRPKRQWNYSPIQQQCPPGCFPCTPIHCQAYQCIQPQAMPMVRCCCRPVIISRPQPDLKTACDGEEAVAACLNGLCGQGYFCQRGKYCCRCPVGKSIGRCVNGLCPVGYVCNSNDFCCAVGTNGGAIGPCVNGECPEGFACGEGDLCYPNSGGTSFVSMPRTATRNFPMAGRIKRPHWTTMTTTIRRRGGGVQQQKGRKNSGTKRRWWGRRGNPWPVRRAHEWTDGAWEESREEWDDDNNDLR
uniref:Uncharacterized protein n=1 Tax=Globodera rostochiensis TaxID=31243 RepID=A0A914HHB9_GLORO